MQFMTIDEVEAQAMAEHDVGEELSPGVTITRRRILGAGVAGVFGLVAAGCSATGRQAPGLASAAPTSLTIEELLATIRPEATRLIASAEPDEASYLAAVSARLARYDPEPPWSRRDVGDQGWALNAAAYVPPVIVYGIEMRPGATIHLHDHRHYNGVLLCTAGSVRCRSFDIVHPDGQRLDVLAGELPPEDEDFLIRQSRDATLREGQLSTLARDRDNIHHVVAGPEGCTLTDVFTHFRPEARSYELVWDERPLSAGGDLYRVSWKT